MRVHQLLVRLDSGDAVSNQALAIHRLLLERGVESHIFAGGMDEFGSRYALLDTEYRPYRDSREDLLIFHYSIYADHYTEYVKSANRKVLIYHNITPAESFEPLRRGRDHPLPAGDGNCCRSSRVATWPWATPTSTAGNWSRWVSKKKRRGSCPSSPSSTAYARGAWTRNCSSRLSDSTTNLLYVGRIVPNKCIEDVIRLFHHYHRGVNAHSRLVLAGRVLPNYAMRLWRLVEELELEDRVLFLGRIDDRGLRTCYRYCDFYICMSEHEGFCVPLLEAFACELPVFAYAAGAVPETMGPAGVLFEEKSFPLLCETLESVRGDRLLRQRIVDAQLRRLDDFSEESFVERFDEFLGRYLN